MRWVVVLLVGCGTVHSGDQLDGGLGSAGESDAGVPDAIDGTDAAVDWPASTCAGATDLADVPTVVGAEYATLPHVVRAGNRDGLVWTAKHNATLEVMFGWLDASMKLVPGSTVVASLDDGQVSSFGRIAWSGSELGLVYGDGRNGPGHRNAYFARLDATGNRIANSELQLGAAGTQTDDATVAWDPVHAQWGVAWTDRSSLSSLNVHFARLDAQGAPVPHSEIVLEPDAGDSGSLSDAGSPLIWTGTQWALAWKQSTAVMVTEIPALGGTPRTIRICAAAGQPPVRPTIAWDGTHYGVVWMQWTGHYTTTFALVDAHGVIPGTLTALGDPNLYGGEPSIVWTGTHYAVAFGDETGMPGQSSSTGRMWIAILDGAGKLVSGTMRAITCDGKLDFFGAIAWNGSELSLPYSPWDMTSDDADVRIVRFPATEIP